MTFEERLTLALKYSGLNQRELADRCGMPKAMISQYKHGRAAAKFVNAKLMADAMGVSVEWLMGGHGPMLPQDIDREKEFLDNYRLLNKTGKEKAEEYVRDLAEQPKYTKSDKGEMIAY